MAKSLHHDYLIKELMDKKPKGQTIDYRRWTPCKYNLRNEDLGKFWRAVEAFEAKPIEVSTSPPTQTLTVWEKTKMIFRSMFTGESK